MKTFLVTIAVVASALSVSASQAVSADVQAAQKSVDSWLSLIDAESYAKSWDEAASFFRVMGCIVACSRVRVADAVCELLAGRYA